MYNKLFSKIVTSSIWMEPTATRMIWITFLAVMDEDGFAPFASVANLAHTARIDLTDAIKAVQVLEAPDENSGDKDHDGRRIERVPGGWLILNASKYRDLVTRVVAREKTRERVRRYRERNAGNAKTVTANAHVTQSETDTETYTDSEEPRTVEPSSTPRGFVGKVPATKSQPVTAVVRIFEHWKTVHRHPNAKLDNKRLNVIRRALDDYTEGQLCEAISGYCNSPHHMGQNAKATVYDDISLLLRDASHIDAGLKFFAEPPRADLSEKTRKIVSNVENWSPPDAGH